MTEHDRDTFTESVGDLIALDAVPVVASSNRNVSPCFLRLAKLHTIEMIRKIHLVMALQPTQHYWEVNFPLWLLAESKHLAYIGETVKG